MSVQVAIPNKVHLFIDYDIVENTAIYVPHFAYMVLFSITQMNTENWKELTNGVSDKNPENFGTAIRMHGCDICKLRCGEDNPIYTNPKRSGADICTRCIVVAFESGKLKIVAQENSMMVFNLSNFVEILKPNKKITFICSRTMD